MIYLNTDLESSSAYRRPTIVCDSWDLVSCSCNFHSWVILITKSSQSHYPHTNLSYQHNEAYDCLYIWYRRRLPFLETGIYWR